MKKLEPLIWTLLLSSMSGLVYAEGRRHRDLEARAPLTAEELYRELARSKIPVQIVDVRAEEEDAYRDSHIPGAIPLPGCVGSSEWIVESMPSVIVSSDGDASTFEKCRSFFTNARNLAGGMTAWVDANYPEDEGEYSPPRVSAGGGCL